MLLWSESMGAAAREAAEEGHIEILAFLMEAVMYSNGEHAGVSIIGKASLHAHFCVCPIVPCPIAKALLLR